MARRADHRRAAKGQRKFREKLDWATGLISGYVQEQARRFIADYLPRRTLPATITAMGLVEATAKRALVKVAAHRPAVACRAGCAWCCHRRVSVTVPEVIVVVTELQHETSPTIFAAVRQRLSMETAGPCPLLVDDKCSVHGVRPFSCRAISSHSALVCAGAVAGGADPALITYDALQGAAWRAAVEGIRAELGETGHSSDLVDLSKALSLTLGSPNAVDRWLAGEDVFASARGG